MEQKYYLLIIGFIVLIGIILISGCIQQQTGCTKEGKICPDGTVVGRNPILNCEFDPCPAIQYCDVNNPCPKGKNCYSFPREERSYCYTGDPCIKCASNKCDILESYPVQIVCK